MDLLSDYWIDPDRGKGYVLLTNSIDAVELNDWARRAWFDWYVREMR